MSNCRQWWVTQGYVFQLCSRSHLTFVVLLAKEELPAISLAKPWALLEMPNDV